MTTYTVGSAAYSAACEQAKEQILADMEAGAIGDYIDGDSAQEFLGTIIKLHQNPRRDGEGFQDWMDRVAGNLDLFIQDLIDRTVENNIERVAQENSK